MGKRRGERGKRGERNVEAHGGKFFPSEYRGRKIGERKEGNRCELPEP